MKAAGLKAIDTVVESTAVLIKSKSSSTNNQLIAKIVGRIKGVISRLSRLPQLFDSRPCETPLS